jgi:MYXO-CTERM domain-containing protein
MPNRPASRFAALLFVALPGALFASAGSPLWAGNTAHTTVDEPAALALLALGVVGLIVGRQAARRRD